MRAGAQLMLRRKRKHMEWARAALLIVTNDEALREVLGGKLRQWGASVHDHDPGEGQASLARAIDVILVDVRHHAEMMLSGLGGIRAAMPFAEMVLINSSGNVNASMAGMRAGASDELTVPFDMEALKQKMIDACRRSKRRHAKNMGSLITVFEDAMSAAAFAEAGEFETARSILEASGSGNETEGVESGKKEDGFNHSNASKR